MTSEDSQDQFLRNHVGMELVDLDSLQIPHSVISKLSKEVCLKHTIFPLDCFDEVLTVVFEDSLTLDAYDKIRLGVGLPHVEPVCSSREQILSAIQRYYKPR